ncbi:ATP-dependent RNA helicase HrpA [Akkermansiaceae bacterium]|nr:ATP-dependent RNA helicase HrpA [Akkermansiaceae bacterium]
MTAATEEALHITYPDLPVSRRREEILEAMRASQVVVVVGETGSGKTTQLPKMAIELAREMGAEGRIGCTQPRRLAATSVARRVAEELKVEVGQEVGWQVRFTEVCSKETKVKFMTDGILLAETQGDRSLKQYNTIIIDEAHERSLNIDFLLGYLKQLVTKRRDLRVVISSATLDAGRFAEFFGNCPVVQVEGRTFPVEDIFLPPWEGGESLREHVLRGVDFVTDLDPDGDVLVFLPGEREIRECAEMVQGHGFVNTEAVPVFARLSLQEQEQIFQPSGKRRIFMATNVAETSLTIPGIVSVVDSGQARVSRFHPDRQVQSLQIEMVSKASARQRRGRCGRVREGICVKLYEEETLEMASEFTDPEIRRSALSGVILRMLSLGLGDVRNFPFLDPPSPKAVREGWKTLEEVGAVEIGGRKSDGRGQAQAAQSLTDTGWRLAKLPLDPRLGRMLIESEKRGVFEETLIIVSALSAMDVRERPRGKEERADEAQLKFLDERSDFGVFLNLWRGIGEFREGKKIRSNQLRKWCEKNFISYRRVREWLGVNAEIRRSLRSKGQAEKELATPGDVYAEVHKSILTGVPRQIGVWDKEKRTYHGVSNLKFAVFPGSGLFKQKRALWVIGFELVETTRLWARKVAEIDPKWVEEVVPHLCRKKYYSPYWNEQQGAVYGLEDVLLGGLSVVEGRRIFFGRVNPKAAFEVFVREALVEGKMRGKHPVIENLAWVKDEIFSAERKLRRVGYLWNEVSAYDFFFERIPAFVNTTKAFMDLTKIGEEAEKLMVRFSDLIWEEGIEERVRLFPDLVHHGGRDWPVSYVSDLEAEDDGLTFEVGIENLLRFPDHLASWGVAGILAERIELLIRSLPKDWRRECQPVAERVEGFIEFWKDWEPQGSLADAVLEYLRENTGRPIEGIEEDRLPANLRPKIRVRDEKGEVLAFGENVTLIKEELAAELRARREAAANEEWEMTGGEVWSFGEVPEQADGGVFPALVDEGETVGMRAFLDPEEANESHRAGVVRLFLLEHHEHGNYVRKNFPLKMAGRFMLPLLPDGSVEDFIRVAGEGALGKIPRNEFEFADQAASARGEWFGAAQHITEAVESMADADGRVREWMERNRNDRNLGEVVLQFEEQRAFLLRSGFGWKAGFERMKRYQKYFLGMEERIARIEAQPLIRDEDKQVQFLPLWNAWQEQWHDRPEAVRLWEIGWMLEEWRLQLFAPGVPHTGKVSAKRIEKALGL